MANNFFLIALVNFFSAIFLLYLLFRLFQLSFNNPIVSNSFKYLEPFLKPFRFVLPILFGIDLSALALVIVAKFGLFNLIFSADQIFDTVDALSWAAISSLYMASQIIRYSLFISIFASWLAPKYMSWSYATFTVAISKVYFILGNRFFTDHCIFSLNTDR